MFQPSEIGFTLQKQKIAVTEFKKDNVGLAGKIEANLVKAKLDHKRFFTVINRRDIQQLFQEQKLQSSELIDPKTAAKIGKFAGVESIITGEVVSAKGSSHFYKRDRQRCLRYTKAGCTQWHFYKDTCKSTSAIVSANIDIIDVATATLLFGESFTESYNRSSCNLNSVLSKSQAINMLAKRIAQKFTSKLLPSYRYIEIELLDDLDVDLSSTDEDLFDDALISIKNGRYKKAKRILQKLLDSVNGNSYVLAYDLGITLEALGEPKEAQKMFYLADEKARHPIKAIDAAILRIEEEVQNLSMQKGS